MTDHAKELADALGGLLRMYDKPSGNPDEDAIWESCAAVLDRYRAATKDEETPVTGEWYESVGGQKSCADEPEWRFVATPTTGYLFALTDAEGNVYTRAKFKQRCMELGIQLKGPQ